VKKSAETLKKQILKIKIKNGWLENGVYLFIRTDKYFDISINNFISDTLPRMSSPIGKTIASWYQFYG